MEGAGLHQPSIQQFFGFVGLHVLSRVVVGLLREGVRGSCLQALGGSAKAGRVPDQGVDLVESVIFATSIHLLQCPACSAPLHVHVVAHHGY